MKSYFTLALLAIMVVGCSQNKPATESGQTGKHGDDKTVVEQTAKAFLDALAEGDIETMKSLSIGSVRGWVSDDQCDEPGVGQLPGMCMKKLSMIVEARQIWKKNADLLTRIQETAVDDDFAAIKILLPDRAQPLGSIPWRETDNADFGELPLPIKNESYAIFLFCRSKDSWYFVAADDTMGALSEALGKMKQGLEELLAIHSVGEIIE